MPPTPRRSSYRIKASDNAMTVPGRVTFPKGTFVPQAPKLPTNNYYNSERNRSTNYTQVPGTGPSPYALAPGTPASGLSGNMGAPSAMLPNRPFQGVPSQFYRSQPGYNDPGAQIQNIIAQRPLSSAYGTDDSWWRPTAQASQPLTPPGLVTTPIGTGSSEFMNTGFMQANAANNVAFNNQLRWDPDRKKYVQLGKLIKEGRLNLKTGKLGKKKRRGGDDEPAAAPAPVDFSSQARNPQPVQQAIPQPSIANAFVSFRA